MSHRKSSPPKPPRSTGAPTIAPSRRSGWRKWIVLGLVITVVVASWVWISMSSHADLAQARRLLPTDPAAAEQLAERAVTSAGGNFPEAQLVQCRALAAMGQWDAALGGMSLIKKPSLCNPDELLDLGHRAMQAGQWQLAEISLQAASSRESGAQSGAFDLLVQLQLRFQRPAEALELCREWQRRVPDAATPWAITGDMAMASVDFGASIADYREALRRHPSQDLEHQVRSSLAQVLVLSGDVPAGRREFDLLMKSKPLAGKVQLAYVQLLRLEGRFDEGLAEIEQYLAKSGSNSESLRLRGILLLDVGKPDLAIADLKQSVALNPYDIGAQHKLAQAYLQTGAPESAKPHLEHAQKMTDATYRISEVQQRVRAEPGNAAALRELKELNAILGR